MGSNHKSLGVTLGALFLASCAGQNVETTAASQQEPAAEADAQDMIVTGSRVRVGNVEAEGQFKIGTVAPSPPPPPPPVMAAPAMRQERGTWPPFYKDVGRDKFNSFAENAFKLVQEAPVSTFSIDVDTAS